MNTPLPRLAGHRARRSAKNNPRGYFGVVVCNPKHDVNVGTLWRSALNFGAAFFGVVGPRIPPQARRNATTALPHVLKQASDTSRAQRHIPFLYFTSLEDTRMTLLDARLVGVELDDRAQMLDAVTHPKRAIYVLGAEDNGLTRAQRDLCDCIVQVPVAGSLNVAVAGSLVLYDRVAKVRSNKKVPDAR